MSLFTVTPAMFLPDEPACWANYMGVWAIEPSWMRHALSLLQQSPIGPPVAFVEGEQQEPILLAQAPSGRPKPYLVHNGSVAYIPLQGPLMKSSSKFGGTSTVRARRMVTAAARDSDISRILLHIDSPGGHVSGTQEFADAIYAARDAKPVDAHIDDLGASAAYWLASQANRITINRAGEAGNIGAYAVLEDSSSRMDRLGIKVHVVSTGRYKALGVDGAPITSEALAYFQERVNHFGEHFREAVQRGRGFSTSHLEEISEGRSYTAQEALRLGLVDGISSLDEALDASSGQPQRRMYSYTAYYERIAARRQATLAMVEGQTDAPGERDDTAKEPGGSVAN